MRRCVSSMHSDCTRDHVSTLAMRLPLAIAEGVASRADRTWLETEQRGMTPRQGKTLRLGPVRNFISASRNR